MIKCILYAYFYDAGNKMILVDTMQSKKSPLYEFRYPSLDPVKDTPLYKSPRYLKDCEILVERGTDLFVHTADDGSLYYYFYHWSLYPNESNICQLIGENALWDFISKRRE